MSMSPEERQMLTELFERVRGQAGAPRDKEAETFIADAVRAQPYAPYLLAQAVLVQEQALKGADQKIRDLETRLAQAEEAAQQPQQGGGFLGGLFGGGAQRAAAQQPSPWGRPAPQQQAPQPAPWGGAPQAPQAGGGLFGNGGGGFLKGALGAAAGVAGGMLLVDSLKGVFGGHGGGFGAGGFGGGETIVNNYYEEPQGGQGGQDYQDASYQDDGGYAGDDGYSDDV